MDIDKKLIKEKLKDWKEFQKSNNKFLNELRKKEVVEGSIYNEVINNYFRIKMEIDKLKSILEDE